MCARNARRLSTDPEIRDLGQTLAACVAVPTVAFATFDALSFAQAASLTFLIIGCVGAYWRLARAQPAPPVTSNGFPGGGWPASPKPPQPRQPPPPKLGPWGAPDFSDTDPIPVIRDPIAR